VAKTKEGEFRKTIPGFYLYAMGAAAIIGPWLVMMQWWQSLTGPSITLAFVIVGLMCVPIALVYGELTSMLPYVGGPFVFIQNAFGRHVSYVASWSLLLAYFTVIAFQLGALTNIVMYLWWPDMGLAGVIGLPVIFTLICAFLNSRQVSISASAQFGMFVVLMVIGVVIVVLFVGNPQFSASNFHPYFTLGRGAFLTATGLMVTMFFGFEIIPQFAEESKYPVKKQWKLILGSLVTCIVFYALLCTANSGMLPYEEMIATPMVSATVAAGLYGTGAQYAICIATFCALATCVNGFWLATSRILYSMGKARLLPKQLGTLNKHGVPHLANWLIVGVVAIFIALTGTRWLEYLFTLMAVGIAIAYLVTCLAFIRLRKVHPEWRRGWKMPGGIAAGVVATIFAAIITYYSFCYFDAALWRIFAVWVVIGFAIWGALQYMRRRNPSEYEVIRVPTGSVEGSDKSEIKG